MAIAAPRLGTIRIITALPCEAQPGLASIDLIKCRLPVGFRFLVTVDMEIVEAVLLFLFDTYAPGKKRWNKVVLSQSAACDDLYEWWYFLDLMKLDWRDVDTDEVVAYRTALENAVSPRTRQRYRANTIRRRLRTIVAFYKWALTWKYTGQAVEASDVLPEADGTVPNAFNNVHELQAVLMALGPNPSEQDRDGRPARDRLAAMVALATGARISEVLALTLADILGLKRPFGADPTAGLVLWLRETKRRRPRKVVLPIWLLDELLTYLEGERAAAVARARELGRTPAPNLFINGVTSNKRDVGRPLTRRVLSRNFRSAVIAAGLCTVLEADAENGLPERLTAAHSFHDLRHTFAVQQYLARRARGDAEPWKTISGLLGHKSWKTTMDIYLSSVPVAEASCDDAMAEYFRGILTLNGTVNALR